MNLIQHQHFPKNVTASWGVSSKLDRFEWACLCVSSTNGLNLTFKTGMFSFYIRGFTFTSKYMRYFWELFYRKTFTWIFLFIVIISKESRYHRGFNTHFNRLNVNTVIAWNTGWIPLTGDIVTSLDSHCNITRLAYNVVSQSQPFCLKRTRFSTSCGWWLASFHGAPLFSV